MIPYQQKIKNHRCNVSTNRHHACDGARGRAAERRAAAAAGRRGLLREHLQRLKRLSALRAPVTTRDDIALLPPTNTKHGIRSCTRASAALKAAVNSPASVTISAHYCSSSSASSRYKTWHIY